MASKPTRRTASPGPAPAVSHSLTELAAIFDVDPNVDKTIESSGVSFPFPGIPEETSKKKLLKRTSPFLRALVKNLISDLLFHKKVAPLTKRVLNATQQAHIDAMRAAGMIQEADKLEESFKTLNESGSLKSIDFGNT